MSDVEFLRRWSSEHLGFETNDFTVFWYLDPIRHIDAYIEWHKGLDPDVVRERYQSRWSKGAPDHGGYRHIFTCTCEHERKRLSLSHEYFHVLQMTFAGYVDDPSVRGTPVPPTGPVWLTEGFATYMSMLVAAELGVDQRRYTPMSAYLEKAAFMPPLSSQETGEGVYGLDVPLRYASGFIAVKLLAESFGPRTLIDYYSYIGQGNGWEAAFEMAFKMTAGEFYGAYAKTIAAESAGSASALKTTSDPYVPFLDWQIGEGVSEADRETALEAVRLAHDYAKAFNFPDIKKRVTFYLFHDIDALADAFEKKTGRTLVRGGAGPRFADGKSTAVAGRGWIVLNTSVPSYESATRAEKMKVLSHELFHSYQYGIASSPVGGPEDQVPRGGPRWLSEGSAEFLAFRSLSHGGQLSYESLRRADPGGFVRRAIEVKGRLREMETWTGFSGIEGSSYTFGLMAAELLASSAGEGSMGTYYSLLQPGTTWQESFRTAFGMGVQEFYELFEAHRAAGFPELELPKTRPE